MSRFTLDLCEKGRCRIRHDLAATEIITDLPPEYGGRGRSFSSTDLISAALGSCILTSIDTILEREGFDSKKLKVSVEKSLSQKPKMISAIALTIFYPDKLNELLLQKLERAAAACPVKRSLHEGIAVSIRFVTGKP